MPRRLDCRGGASVVAADDAAETEGDPNVKATQEARNEALVYDQFAASEDGESAKACCYPNRVRRKAASFIQASSRDCDAAITWRCNDCRTYAGDRVAATFGARLLGGRRSQEAQAEVAISQD